VAPLSLSVLLAEDNEVNRKVAERMLSMAGCRVTMAATGQEVLQALEKSSFDAVLMDVQLPVLDGLQTTARIRECEKTTGKHLPIIAMTAHAMKGDREKCLEAGMDEYISKPLNAKHLGETISRVMSQQLMAADDHSQAQGQN
jgi:CheY-like chemotaxis protein